jgi:predicted dehydrogenase
MIQAPDAAPLLLGFIGGALNSAVGYAHFAASTMDNKWSLVAGCFCGKPELNRQTALRYGVIPKRDYDCWKEMLKKEKGQLDAIVILTPTPLHFEMVIACLNEGYPVICEKALVTNSVDAKKIFEARGFNNGFLAVTYNYSGYPMVRELRHIIQKGVLGKIIHFQAEMPQEGFIRVDAQGNKPAPQPWRLADGSIPTIHLDLAVHLHQVVYYLIGKKPLEVVSDQDSFGWFSKIIDNVACLCRYSDGVKGQMWFSKSALGQRNGLRFRIYGSKASAEWYQLNPEELLISHADGRREILDRASSVEVTNLCRYNRFKAGHPAGFIEAFANLYSDIADGLRQYKTTGQWKSEDVFSVELAFEGLRMLEAMRKSVDTKSWQAVDSQI